MKKQDITKVEEFFAVLLGFGGGIAFVFIISRGLASLMQRNPVNIESETDPVFRLLIFGSSLLPILGAFIGFLVGFAIAVFLYYLLIRLYLGEKRFWSHVGLAGSSGKATPRADGYIFLWIAKFCKDTIDPTDGRETDLPKAKVISYLDKDFVDPTAASRLRGFLRILKRLAICLLLGLIIVAVAGFERLSASIFAALFVVGGLSLFGLTRWYNLVNEKYGITDWILMTFLFLLAAFICWFGLYMLYDTWAIDSLHSND
ncbi:MAG: hypothetical protein HRT89_18975 [Lentisphaeria bacterium]|nr:hypothetical protein [Lentisphaeria bacterium]NQZ70141.1 hypothetical protein [Lentisphaeria bacterium]